VTPKMKIAILSGELSSGMQIYLLLCDKHSVQVATEVEELLRFLEGEKYDLTFLDFGTHSAYSMQSKCTSDLMQQIIKMQPNLRLIGVCDEQEKGGSDSEGHFDGFITRPINSEELLKLVQE
jgi:CheY-like chemotaxis protein